MSAVAGSGLDQNREAVDAMRFHETREREFAGGRMEAVRDTLIVLGLQIVFRTMMILRRWNY
jgi:hypothetical protein